MTRCRLFYKFLTATLLVCSLCGLHAAADLIVSQVAIDCHEPKNVSEAAIQAHIRQKPGDVYDPSSIDHSIRSLYETGWFDLVRTETKELADNKVAITFVLEPKLRISSIQFEGNKKLRERSLKGQITSKDNNVLDEAQLRADANKLLELYRKKGYADAVVDYQITRQPKQGKGTVVFQIFEGECQKIDKISFVGNDHVKSDRLKRIMDTKAWHIFSWLTGGGRYQQEMFSEDLNKLRDCFKNEGFLDVEIAESEIKLENPKPGKMHITIRVHEGRRYYVGAVKISKNTLYPKENLQKVLVVKTGGVFSPEAVEKSCEGIRDFYGHFGYLETYAEAIRTPNVETNNIDLEFVVHESERFYVESINIQGNTKTRGKVILRELALAPGDVFDLVKMKNSQVRLMNTDFFEEVILTPETTPIPNRKNLRVSVKEGRTGGFQIGGGFNTEDKLNAFIEYQQGNFDITNPRSYFQGAGQKFRVRTQIGFYSNQIIVSFEEPWLFDRELAFGVEATREQMKYRNSHYHELRMGVEFYFRKRLFELVVGRLSYSIEQVKIDHVKSDASPILQEEKGTRSVSKVGFSMYRDTRDNVVYPTSGNYAEVGTQVAGGPFRGQTNYWRLEGNGSQFWTLFETGKQVLGIGGRTGTVTPYGKGKRVPLFERYFLGGQDDMRGFESREVGPKDENDKDKEPLGGNTYGYASAEYSIKVFEPVRLATFYDIGFVSQRQFRWKFKDYNSDWGVGLRIFILKAPLRLDLGFPIRSDKYNRKGTQFNFSFGTTF